ncbi:MAG: non-canonical purine NTP pyrophosphatase [Nanoarchaeota archaeon]|nr:non-canonical purine NTP pyrophosphatase [Nanoarchaeota archaeon]
MKIQFITKNRHKFEEVEKVMKEFDIELVQLSEDKIEPKELNIREIAELNAKHFFEKTGKPVMVDDTGVFFFAYPNFPGNHPKLMFNLLGYKGLLKLIDNEENHAEFRTIAAFYDGKELKVFEGVLEGEIGQKVFGKDRDVMPYERIFLVEGKPLCDYTREEKNRFSHRAKAFREMGEWLRK